jgi:hypothetical protein
MRDSRCAYFRDAPQDCTGMLRPGSNEGGVVGSDREPFTVWNIRGEILQLGYVLRRQDFGHSLAMLLGRNPAVDQSLPKRSECLFAILVRSKPLGPLVVCQHALTIVREAVIKSSALLWLPLQWTWATAARKDCYPDRRVRQDLQLRTGGRPERRSCRCPYAFQGQESSRHNTAISRWHRVCVRLGQNCGKVAAWPRRPSW